MAFLHVAQRHDSPGDSEPLCGFLVFQLEGGQHWAALLALDTSGVPHEFVYAGPVHPTPAQALLYGPTLEGQILLQSLALPMLKALRAYLCCLLVTRLLPPGLPLPVGLYAEGQIRWLGETTCAAEQFIADFDAGLGLVEPFQRASNTLRYVIEHESPPVRADDLPGAPPA